MRWRNVHGYLRGGALTTHSALQRLFHRTPCRACIPSWRTKHPSSPAQVRIRPKIGLPIHGTSAQSYCSSSTVSVECKHIQQLGRCGGSMRIAHGVQRRPNKRLSLTSGGEGSVEAATSENVFPATCLGSSARTRGHRRVSRGQTRRHEARPIPRRTSRAYERVAERTGNAVWTCPH